jgi:hypothetical protein
MNVSSLSAAFAAILLARVGVRAVRGLNNPLGVSILAALTHAVPKEDIAVRQGSDDAGCDGIQDVSLRRNMPKVLHAREEERV